MLNYVIVHVNNLSTFIIDLYPSHYSPPKKTPFFPTENQMQFHLEFHESIECRRFFIKHHNWCWFWNWHISNRVKCIANPTVDRLKYWKCYFKHSVWLISFPCFERFNFLPIERKKRREAKAKPSSASNETYGKVWTHYVFDNLNHILLWIGGKSTTNVRFFFKFLVVGELCLVLLSPSQRSYCDALLFIAFSFSNMEVSV